MATPGVRYTEAEKRAALELAATIGMSAAAEQLQVGRKTLYRWTRDFPTYWSDLLGGDPEAHRRGYAQSLETLAARYAEAEHMALDVAEDKLDNMSAKELAAIIKAMGSSRQAATVGARAVRGEDTATEVNINFPQIEQAMERLLNGAPAPALPVPNEAESD